jgi:protein phosphatase
MTTLDARGRSDVGRVRKTNEDRFFIGVMHKSVDVKDTNVEVGDAIAEMARLDAHLLVVADGVGGVSGGERASQSAVFSLATFIGRTAACHFDPDVEQEEEFLQRLEQALQRAHEVVRSLSTTARGPATTLTMALVVSGRAYIAHVGDSRAYVLRHGQLKQVTRDQTVSAFLSEAGVSHDSSGENRLAGVLASAVGSHTMIPSVGLVDIAPGDSLLLCSDGLTKHLKDDQIAALLTAEGDAGTACNALVDAALAGGGSDNVTVVVARLTE